MLGAATAALGAGAVQRKLAQRLVQRRAQGGGQLQLKAGSDTTAADTTAAGGGDEALRKEFDSFAVKGNVEGGFEGFKKIHDRLIATFGDIPTANTYYKGVKNLPFLGRTPQVHTTLHHKLVAAEALLKQKGWLDAILAEKPSAGGFNVRENRNSPGKLSDHSFGWAVDIEAALNPNVKQFPAAVVKGITGEGMFTGEANSKIDAGGKAEELLPWAEKMRDASTNFRAAFENEGTLKQAMVDYLTGSLGMTIKAEGLDLAMIKAAKETGKDKAAKKSFQDLVAVLVGAHADVVKATAEQDEEEREAFVEKNGWKNWAKHKKQRDDKRKARQANIKNVAEANAKKDHRSEATDADWEAAAASYNAESEHEVAVKAARFLVEMHGIYRASFDKKTTSGRKDASSVGSAGSIAANGFISLQPELIAAMTGSDGGNLTWLGNGGTKDFMHFQLHSGDRPALK